MSPQPKQPAQPAKSKPSGAPAKGGKPASEWTVEQPFDSADYLEGAPPSYAGDQSGSDQPDDADQSDAEQGSGP